MKETATPPATGGQIVGYARTSTVEQEAGLDSQIVELRAAGCERIFSEQLSSVDAARPELKAALDWCRTGDTFVVTRPDRLARNVADLLRIVGDLKARGVTVRILSMAVDTGTATGLLILQVLGAVGEFERNVMLERQRHGIAKAKSLGKYKGRAPTAVAKTDEVRRLLSERRSISEIVQQTGISRASVYRIRAVLEDLTV